MSEVETGLSRSDGSPSKSIRRYLAEELTDSWGDAILLPSCYVTGLIDSAVFNVWDCFVCMQTGNTIYAGLGVSGQPPDQPWRWCKALVAILSFITGAYLFSRGMRACGELRRGTVIASNLLQALLTCICALLGMTGVVPSDAGKQLPQNFIVLLPIALLSLQSAGQCHMSRVLGYGELPTVVLTSAYCDLVVDEKVWTAPLRENSKRNRRVLSVVLMLLGAITGGFLTIDGDVNYALWVGGAIKVGIAITWLFWKSKGSIRLE